ncbi:MAG: tetratricopeptide repeat protein [Pseudomonadota bacterium]
MNVRELSFDLLAFLLRRWPETVSLQDAADQVWRQNHLSEATLTKRVALLRRALGDSAAMPRYVRKVRGVGYVMIPEVHHWEDPSTANPLSWFAPKVAIGAFAITALLGTGYFSLSHNSPSAPSERELIAGVSDFQLSRARDLLRLHQPAETDLAIELLEQIIARDEASPDAELALSFAYSTRATKFRAEQNDIGRAEKLARRLIGTDLNSSGAWHALAYALDAQGRVDGAIAAYEQAFTLDQNDVAAMSSAAYLFRIRGRLHDALELEAMAMTSERASIYAPVQIATTLSLLDHEAADEWWYRALAAGPNQLVVLTARMEFELYQDNPSAALLILERAPEVLQSMPEALRLQGRALLKLGRLNEAQLAFNRAGSDAWLETAMMSINAGEPTKYTELFERLDQMMLEGDSWPELRIRSAELHAAVGNYDEAVRLISRAIDLGWRDWNYVQTSPFLEPLSTSQKLAQLGERINHEVDAQKRLVLASNNHNLRSLLAPDESLRQPAD